MPSRYAKDFSRIVINTLRTRGIVVTGGTWLAGPDGSYANGERGYTLEERGTHIVRSYEEVLALAA